MKPTQIEVTRKWYYEFCQADRYPQTMRSVIAQDHYRNPCLNKKMTESLSLPAEVRRMILIAALYRTYESEEVKSALRDPNSGSSVFVEADVKLGQRTLSALKMT